MILDNIWVIPGYSSRYNLDKKLLYNVPLENGPENLVREVNGQEVSDKNITTTEEMETDVVMENISGKEKIENAAKEVSVENVLLKYIPSSQEKKKEKLDDAISEMTTSGEGMSLSLENAKNLEIFHRERLDFLVARSFLENIPLDRANLSHELAAEELQRVLNSCVYFPPLCFEKICEFIDIDVTKKGIYKGILNIFFLCMFCFKKHQLQKVLKYWKMVKMEKKKKKIVKKKKKI